MVILSLMFLFGGLHSEIDNIPVLPVSYLSGAPCGPWTPVGSSCVCNHYVVRKRAKPDWIPAPRDGGTQKFTRPGWHYTNTKGMHSSGNVCYHDS